MYRPRVHDDALATHFETHRPHLLTVAHRLLSSRSEAQDAVQETWLRVSRADRSAVENLAGWLTTVVARVCLDVLRARKARSASGEHGDALASISDGEDASSPEANALRAETVGVALLVILETLKPAERLAFLLHDVFDVPFHDIAAVAECSPEAARQLATRARRRVRGASADQAADLLRHRGVVEAFLHASRTGDVAALLAVLAPDVVLRPDQVALVASAANLAKGAPKLAPEVRGTASVADAFAGRAVGARPALIDGQIGTVWAVGGKPRAVFRFTFVKGVIGAIDLIADPAHLRRLEVVMLDA